MLGSGPRKGPLPGWKAPSDKTALVHYQDELDTQSKNHGDIVIIKNFINSKRFIVERYVIDIQSDEVKFLLIKYNGGHTISLKITASIEDPIKFYNNIYDDIGSLYIELDPYKHMESLFNNAGRVLTPNPAVIKFIYNPRYNWLRACVTVEKDIIWYRVIIGTVGDFSEDIDNFILEQNRK